MKKTAFFTVDVDCDLAWPGKGTASVTKGKDVAEFTFSGRGLVALVGLVNRLRIPATFFFEARTASALSKTLDLNGLMEGHEVACHGLEHEDFTALDFFEESKRIAEAKRVLENVFGRKILGFRAPFLKADADLLDALAVEGFQWDSSCLVRDGVLPQLPANEKLYFWPVIEGRVSEGAFVERVFSAENSVLSTHSWHSVTTLEGVERKPDLERRVLGKMLSDYSFSRIGDEMHKLKKPRC